MPKDPLRLLRTAARIRALIAEGRLRPALDEYRQAVETHAVSECGDGTLQAARLSEFERQIIEGVLDPEAQRVEQARIAKILLDLVDCIEQAARRQIRIFLSYSHQEPDRRLAQWLHKQLTDKGFEVFFAQEDIAPGEDWYRRIHTELGRCHYFIPLVSERANRSEMVLEELRAAFERRDREGLPHIMPVRVQLPMEAALAYDLAFRLNRLQNLFWNAPQDGQPVLDRLLGVLEGKETPVYDQEGFLPEGQPLLRDSPAAPPVPLAPLELPGGAMPAESPYYIVRAGEGQFIEGLQQLGAVLRIKGPRQYGKTSLLNRVAARARELDYQVVLLSFQQLNEAQMQDADLLLYALCQQVARKLRLPADRLREAWADPGLGCKDKATYYLEDEALRQPLLLALDEADRLFFQPAATDVFSLLRAWREKAVSEPEWKHFRLAVSYSTEVYLAIQDQNQSPFNVGTEYRFDPFTEAQQRELVLRHGLPFTAAQQTQVYELLGGHPFLTRKALYEQVSGQLSFDELIGKAPQDDGPFYDHLRALRLRLTGPDQEPCVRVLKRILGGALPPAWSPAEVGQLDRLRAAGLIRGDGPTLRPACGLYRLYFKDHL